MLPGKPTRYEALIAAACVACGVAIFALPGAAAAWACCGVVLATAGIAAFGVRRPAWQFFGPVTCRIATARKVVVLSFDDGPGPDTTGPLLDLLKRRGVRVTFFWVGSRAEACAQLVRRAAADGHEVENHSWSHAWWTNFMGAGRLREELGRTQTLLEELTGRRPLWFRSPMGLGNPRVARVTRETGLRVAGWSAGGCDQGEGQGEGEVERIVRRLEAGLEPGAVLLLHDAGLPVQRLLAVVEMLVDRLQARGYECVPLDSLWQSESRSATTTP